MHQTCPWRGTGRSSRRPLSCHPVSIRLTTPRVLCYDAPAEAVLAAVADGVIVAADVAAAAAAQLDACQRGPDVGAILLQVSRALTVASKA